MNKPYQENIISNNIKQRCFLEDINSDELKWHWDEEDRIVSVIGNTDWKFQFDNKLPIDINEDIIIPKGVMHRLIKGTGDLNIIIKIVDL